MEQSTPKVDRHRRRGKNGSTPAVDSPPVAAAIPDASLSSATANEHPRILPRAEQSRTPKGPASNSAQGGGKRAKHANNTGNTRNTSNSNPTSRPQSKTSGTPIKAAYAGPTFHSSPAPSALPMPSFLSKSVPEVASSAPRPSHDETEEFLDSSSTSSASGPVTDTEDKSHLGTLGREPSPLDFLFDAARQAQRPPHAKSPSALSTVATPGEESPSRRAPSTNASTNGNIFPIEVDGSEDQPVGPIAPAFATPYQERMNAFRSSRSEANIDRSILEERERKAKTEALKNLLLKSQLPRSASASPGAFRLGNNEQAPRPSLSERSPSWQQYRHSSGPPTPSQLNQPETTGSPIDGFQRRSSQPRVDIGKRGFQAKFGMNPHEPASVRPIKPSSAQNSSHQGWNRFPQYSDGGNSSIPPWSAAQGPKPIQQDAIMSSRDFPPKVLANNLRRALQLEERSGR